VDDGEFALLELSWVTRARGRIEKIAAGEARALGRARRRRRLSPAFQELPWSHRMREGTVFLFPDAPRAFLFVFRTAEEPSRTGCLSVFEPPDKNVAVATRTAVEGFGTGETWEVFGLRAQVPRGYDLASARMVAGWVRLELSRRADRLLLERFSSAGQALKEKGLEGWLRERRRRDWKLYSVLCRTSTQSGHSLFLWEGRARGALARLFGAHRVSGRAWHCPSTDRVLVVESFFRAEAQDAAVARSVPCCGGLRLP
jgi:hypothetical protein